MEFWEEALIASLSFDLAMAFDTILNNRDSPMEIILMNLHSVIEHLSSEIPSNHNI
jgi:hypothetical protein